MVRRHELEDAEWELIRDLIPQGSGMGRPRRDDREMLDAMMWILRTGAPWRDLPERYGPWESAYSRFRKWRDEGVIDRIVERLQLHLTEQGHIDVDLWCIDGSSVRASKSAAGARKKGALQGKKKRR